MSGFKKPTKVKDNPLAVEDPAFWKWRIEHAVKEQKMFHQIILDDSYELWGNIQTMTAHELVKHVRTGQKVLDAGCGTGGLWDCFLQAKQINPHYKVEYVGVDISPDLIRLAKERYPNVQFEVGDLKKLPNGDKTFHWAVCRAVEGMILENVGKDAWEQMKAELLRVAKKVLLISYPTTLEEGLYVEVLG